MEDNSKKDINILFVATGPVGYAMLPYLDWCTMTEMKNSIKLELYEYIMENNLVWYENLCLSDSESSCDENGELMTYPCVSLDDLPIKWWKDYIDCSCIKKKDLDNHRDMIVSTTEKLYQHMTKITYDTVDPYILCPEYTNLTFSESDIINIIKEHDNRVETEYGIKMEFNKHFKMKFQEYISYNSKKYDIIWIMGVCYPDNVFEFNETYIKNFKKSLKDDGYIIYCDPTSNYDEEYDFGLIDFMKRNSYSEDTITLLKFKEQLNVISEGIYQFIINT
jgi:hypothetical protein